MHPSLVAPFVLPQHGAGHRKRILMTIKGQGLAPSPVLSHVRLSREAVFFQVTHQDAKALAPDDWGMGCCLGTIPLLTVILCYCTAPSTINFPRAVYRCMSLCPSVPSALPVTTRYIFRGRLKDSFKTSPAGVRRWH